MQFLDCDERIKIYDRIIEFHSNEEKECAMKGNIEWRDYHILKMNESIRFKKRMLEELGYEEQKDMLQPNAKRQKTESADETNKAILRHYFEKLI